MKKGETTLNLREGKFFEQFVMAGKYKDSTFFTPTLYAKTSQFFGEFIILTRNLNSDSMVLAHKVMGEQGKGRDEKEEEVIEKGKKGRKEERKKGRKYMNFKFYFFRSVCPRRKKL